VPRCIVKGSNLGSTTLSGHRDEASILYFIASRSTWYYLVYEVALLGRKISMSHKEPAVVSKRDDEAQAFSTAGSESSISEDETLLKNARRKVDKRLLLWYSFVYLVMRIHVSNITNTAIINLEQGTGIKKQLGNLTSQQWAWTLSIF
jgi:hypothetical protein